MPGFGRSRLSSVIKAAGDVVSIDDAVATLRLPRVKAAQALAAWAKQGWLQRVGSGVYVPVGLGMLGSEQAVADAWKLIPALFGPAYVGGRTAAEHWDLTEQLFRDIVVFTARPIRVKTRETGGVIFSLQHVSEEKLFGTKVVWRGQIKVAVSDVDRTMVDLLSDPAVGGGIQHVADCLDRYLRKKMGSEKQLVAYGDRLGNGAAFKRLGFLAERHALGGELAAACKSRLTQGYAKLDPGLKCTRVVTRWKLRVPANWVERSAHDRQSRAS
jgi:predicted transcriptional regulator of viral defense system